MFVVISVVVRFWCFNWFVFGSRISNKQNIFRIFVPEIKVETDMETLPDKRKKSPVKIRFKQLADGCKSIYLDTYLNGKRKYEFLKLYIHPGTDRETQFANAEAMRMAEEMRREKLSQLGIEEAATPAGVQEREDATEEQTAKARVRAKRTSRGSTSSSSCIPFPARMPPTPRQWRVPTLSGSSAWLKSRIRKRNLPKAGVKPPPIRSRNGNPE